MPCGLEKRFGNEKLELLAENGEPSRGTGTSGGANVGVDTTKGSEGKGSVAR
jgi:hypothetical protein